MSSRYKSASPACKNKHRYLRHDSTRDDNVLMSIGDICLDEFRERVGTLVCVCLIGVICDDFVQQGLEARFKCHAAVVGENKPGACLPFTRVTAPAVCNT